MKTFFIPRRNFFTILITGLFCFHTQAQGLPEDGPDLPVPTHEALIYEGDDQGLLDIDVIDEGTPDMPGAPVAAEAELIIAPALEALWIRGGATNSTQDDWRDRLGMQLHRWDNIPGKPIRNLTDSREFYGPAAATLQLEAAELSKAAAAAFPIGNNGLRARAILVIPEDGQYSFAISADDTADLYLGEPGGSRFTKKKTLSCTGYMANERDWSKLRTAARTYKAGDVLWLEILNKNDTGAQHVSIAWQKPGDSSYTLIPSVLEDGRVVLTVPPLDPEDPDDIGVPASWLASVGLGGVHPYDDPRARLYYDTDGDGFNLLEEYQTGGRPDEIGGNRGYVNVEKWGYLPANGTMAGYLKTERSIEVPDKNYAYQGGLDLYENGSNYFTRMRTLVRPPLPGKWIFYISADDEGRLLLSSDEKRFSKRLIASHTLYTAKYEWTKYAGQKSAPIELEAGKRYFLEALQYQRTGDSRISIAWQYVPENLCLLPGVTASQSSNYNTASTYKANKAIDGNLGTMNHTSGSAKTPQWLQIDFNTVYSVKRVVLHNRVNFFSRLSNFRICLLDSEGEEIKGEDFYTEEGTHAGEKVVWDLDEAVEVSRIKVQQLGKNAEGNYILHITEVEAYSTNDYGAFSEGPQLIPCEYLYSPIEEPNDLDNNSIPDDWQREKGLVIGENGLSAMDCAEHSDPDDDLISNHEEYLLDTNPLIPSGKPGYLTRELWRNIPGWSVDVSMKSQRILGSPTSRELHAGVNPPRNIGDAFHQRLRGTITAPVTGMYTFWIASKQTSVLYLSPNERKYYKQEIARVGYGEHDNGAHQTEYKEWTVYPRQRSSQIYLEEGKEYFMEIQQKHDHSSTHLTVAWQMPGGEREDIPSEYIASFGGDLADRDDDDLPDDWERQYGIDPDDNGYVDFNNGAWGDPFGTGITNREAFLNGWNPQAPPIVEQGTPVIEIPGNSGSIVDGDWASVGEGMLATLGRGTITYTVNVSEEGRYILEVTGRPSGNIIEVESLPVQVKFNDISLGTITLRSIMGRSGKSTLLLPPAVPGTHTITLTLCSQDLRRSFLIEGIRIIKPEGEDTGGYGMPDWLYEELNKTNHITSCPAASLTSPLCLEGKSRNFSLTALTRDGQTQTLLPGAGTGWYSNVPLPEDGSETSLQVTYELGAAPETRTVSWSPCNMLIYNQYTLRRGDALRVTVMDNSVPSNADITYTLNGQNLGTRRAGQAIVCRFETAGEHQVEASWTQDNQSLSTSMTVKACEADLGNAVADLYSDKTRYYTFNNLPAETVLEADEPLYMTSNEELANGSRKVGLVSSVGGMQYLVARLGEGGPVMNTKTLRCHAVLTTSSVSNIEVVERYEDGSYLARMYISAYSLPPGGYIVVKFAASGMQFLEGGSSKTIRMEDFDENGLYCLFFTFPAGTKTSACHEIYYYDADGNLY